MQSIEEAISKARETLRKKCKWKIIDPDTAEPEKLQYIAGSNEYRSVYFAKYDNENRYSYAVKVTGDNIEDYYLLSTDEIINPIFENNLIVEVDPETMDILAKYYFLFGERSREIKYSNDNQKMQENFICTYDYLPGEYKEIVKQSRIDKNLICGYSDKPYGKMILVNGRNNEFYDH